MTEAKRKPYIKDKAMFSAVSFACNLQEKGEPAQKCIDVASRYYKVSAEDLRAELLRQEAPGFTTAPVTMESKPLYNEVEPFQF